MDALHLDRVDAKEFFGLHPEANVNRLGSSDGRIRPCRTWYVFELATSYQAVYLKNFVTSLNGRHKELIPNSESHILNKSGSEFSLTG